MKKDIQHILDEMVEKFKESKTDSCYLGVPVSEFTKDELLMVIDDLDRRNNLWPPHQGREQELRKAVRSAFGNSPVACDGNLIVSADAYNRIVGILNK